MNPRLFTVSGNMDQIIKHDLKDKYNWVQHRLNPNPEKPNRFFVELTYDQATDLYARMKKLDMVALRNWSR